MFKKMILVGLISMVPIIELRGAIPYAVLWDAQPLWPVSYTHLRAHETL